MDTPLWELRLIDGRGASLFTAEDVTRDVGRSGAVREVPVAADVSDASAISDARRCLADGRVVAATLHMGAVAYALRHG